ncbi:MAG: DUF1932 domain-containing protein [Pseudomonadota bacterium]
MTEVQTVCLLGFGEVGQMLAAQLAEANVRLTAFDTQFDTGNSPPSQAAQDQPEVAVCATAHDAARECQLVISAVTAEQSAPAAQSVLGVLATGTWFLDLNSVSPATKRQTAANVEQARANYVEAAVMAPIQPLGVGAPILIGGPHAAAFAALAEQLGFSGLTVFSNELGKVSAAKMCRSVCIKGMEALVTEALLAARYYGVESTVIDSLQNLLPGVDWGEHARYLIERSLAHGKRRAEEMREVAATLQDAEVEPLMSVACAERQSLTAALVEAVDELTLSALLDRMLAATGDEAGSKETPDAHH